MLFYHILFLLSYRSVNAVSESFFHTLKTELIHHQIYQTRDEAKQAVFEYIEVFYNRELLHLANGYYRH
jgi:putative transposase